MNAGTGGAGSGGWARPAHRREFPYPGDRGAACPVGRRRGGGMACRTGAHPVRRGSRGASAPRVRPPSPALRLAAYRPAALRRPVRARPCGEFRGCRPQRGVHDHPRPFGDSEPAPVSIHVRLAARPGHSAAATSICSSAARRSPCGHHRNVRDVARHRQRVRADAPSRAPRVVRAQAFRLSAASCLGAGALCFRLNSRSGRPEPERWGRSPGPCNTGAWATKTSSASP